MAQKLAHLVFLHLYFVISLLESGKSLKIPPHLKCVAALPCEMKCQCLKATVENTTSVTTHFKISSARWTPGSLADTLNM